MKTRLLFAGLIASAAFVGCTNEDLLSTTEGVAQMNDFALISDAIGGAETRMEYEAGSFKWEINDPIGLSRVSEDGKSVNTNTKFIATKVTDNRNAPLDQWETSGSGDYAYFQTEAESIFGADYVVYYPYNKDFAEEGQGKITATLPVAQVEDATSPNEHVAKDGFMMSTSTHFNPGQTAEAFTLYPVFSRIAVTVKAPSVKEAKLQTVVLRSVDGSKIFPTKATIDADIQLGSDGYLNSNSVVGDESSLVSEIVLNVDDEESSNASSLTDNDGYTATMTVIPGQYKNVEFYIVTNKGAYTSRSYANAPLEAGKRAEFTFTITDAELSTDRIYYASSSDSWQYAIDKIGSMTNNEFGPATIKVLKDIEVNNFRPAKQPLVNVPVTVEGSGTITIAANTQVTYWPNITFNVPVNYGENEAEYIENDKMVFNKGVTAAKGLTLDEKADITIIGGEISTAKVDSKDAVLTVEDATFTGAVTVAKAAGIDEDGRTAINFTDCTFRAGISVKNNDENDGVTAVTINGGHITKASATAPASVLAIGNNSNARNNTVIIEGKVEADDVNVAETYTGFKSVLDINGSLTTDALTKAEGTGEIYVNVDAALTLGEKASYAMNDHLLKVEGTLTNNGIITVGTSGKLVDITQNNNNKGTFVNNGYLLVGTSTEWYENQYIQLQMDGGDFVYTGIADEKAFVAALAKNDVKVTGLQVSATSFNFANAAFQNKVDFSGLDVTFSSSTTTVTVPNGLKLDDLAIAGTTTISADNETTGAAITTGDLIVNKAADLTLGEKMNVTCANLAVSGTLNQGAQVSYTGNNQSTGTITGTPVKK